jgi:sortase (surface protein transpeptidase)
MNRGGIWNRGGRCNRNDTATVVTGTPVQVEAAQETVSKYASRIHVTGIALIVLGLVSLMGSIYTGLNARHGAEKWLKKAMMKASEGKNATMTEETGSEYVSQAEFALVDNLRVISFLSIMISAVVIKMGKVALRASWRLNSWLAKKTFKKSCMRIAFIAIVALIIRSYIKDSIATVKKQVGLKEFSSFNKTEKFHHKKHHSRKLEQDDEFDFEDEEDLDNELDFQTESQMRKFMDIIKGQEAE